MNLEPVRSPAVATSALGHTDHEALAEPARFASCPVLLVNDALVVIPALLNHCLVVAASSKETFASFTREGSKMESSGWFVANSTLLVLQGVDRV